MPNFILRNVPQAVWDRAFERAAREGWPKQALILQLLDDYGRGAVTPSKGPPTQAQLQSIELDAEFQHLVGASVQGKGGPWTIEKLQVSRRSGMPPMLHLTIQSDQLGRREVGFEFVLEKHVLGGRDPMWVLRELTHRIREYAPVPGVFWRAEQQ